MEQEVFEGNWLIAMTPGGDRYIDKVADETGDYYTLSPVFEYVSMIQEGRTPDGQPTLGRVRFCSALDDCLHQTKLFIHLGGTRLHFFEDMHEEDQEKYKKLVLDAMKRISIMRAQKAGISLATEMPSPTPRGFRGA
jgi:hypothetical protein